MLAIPSRRSAHSSVPASGGLTIINQILSILCIDVKLPRSPFKAGTREEVDPLIVGRIIIRHALSRTSVPPCLLPQVGPEIPDTPTLTPGRTPVLS